VLAAFGAYYYEAEAGYESEGAEHGRDGEGAGLFVGDLDWAQVNILLFVSEADSADGKSYDGEEDEECADPCCWLHAGPSFPIE